MESLPLFSRSTTARLQYEGLLRSNVHIGTRGRAGGAAARAAAARPAARKRRRERGADIKPSSGPPARPGVSASAYGFENTTINTITTMITTKIPRAARIFIH